MNETVTLTADPGLVAYVCLIVVCLSYAIISFIYGKDEDL